MTAEMPFTLGYGTNGFTDHPLDAILGVLSHEGYGAIALTLGHPHLDPFAPDGDEQVATLRRRLDELGMRVVVETGTRFLLDPFRKHHPALVGPEAQIRVWFLQRAVEIAAGLRAECVSFFSGVLPEGSTAEEGWARLLDRVPLVVEHARAHGVRLAIEPEPGMLVETVADALRLRRDLGDPPELGVTVDLGHCVVVEPDGVRGALLRAAPHLFNVQVDDMRSTAHEHLPFGEGELDLALAFGTLGEIGYTGVAAVELPRHSYDAPGLAHRSMTAMTAAWEQAQDGMWLASWAPERRTLAPLGGRTVTGTSHLSEPRLSAGQQAWIAVAQRALATDPGSVVGSFARAGRTVGRDPLYPDADPGGVLHGTADDAARAELVVSLSAVLDPDELAASLTELYQRGDTAERRGVLRGLDALAPALASAPSGPVVEAGLLLTADALRANDQSLVAAAVGPFAATYLDQHAWRHAVLKLVFMGVSLEAVAGLDDRADDELARMARDFAAERRAAGRAVPDDVVRLAPDLRPALTTTNGTDH